MWCYSAAGLESVGRAVRGSFMLCCAAFADVQMSCGTGVEQRLFTVIEMALGFEPDDAMRSELMNPVPQLTYGTAR